MSASNNQVAESQTVIPLFTGLVDDPIG